MVRLKLNIGTAVEGVNNILQDQEVVEALEVLGFKDVEILKKADSETETTLVLGAVLKPSWFGRSHREYVYRLCGLLRQDAIAYRVQGGKGYLVGPKALEWGGEFIPEYFID